ncbi:MAG: hypothetical protein AAFR57_15155 [Pseudomonadota bacterium]
MTKRDRSTLKTFFADGTLPTAEHYRDLIDSGVNQIEDGFEKPAEEGLKLKSLSGRHTLMSFYRGIGAGLPVWRLAHGDEMGTLEFQRGPGGRDVSLDAPDNAEEDLETPGLSLDRDGRVGVYTSTPEWRLDVEGVARMRGRVGYPGPGVTIPADGRWHPITETLTGCHILEVVAGAGAAEGAGRYSLLHATAMNAFNPRNPVINWLFSRRSIRRQTAMYGSYADRLRLRWVAMPGPHAYRLELRTNSNFGDDYIVRYYVTRLWFDTQMEGARPNGPPRDQDVT